MKTHYEVNRKPLGVLMAILAFMALSNRAHALSAAQCDAFASGGKVSICHATSSASHSYVTLNVARSGCVGGHAGHEGDYVAVNDPTCSGGSCLPQDAPCDATLPCCEGAFCRDGTCQACSSDPLAICIAAGLTEGLCNTCCFDNPACGSSGSPGNECGNAAGMACSNQEQNEACLAAVIEAGCADECSVCAPSGSCQPQDATCDASSPCCNGLSCTDGTCKVPACTSDPHDACAAAGLTEGLCNTCCFDNPACGSSGGPPGNECGNAAGMGCSNQEQNEACLAAIIQVGCADECKVCTP